MYCVCFACRKNSFAGVEPSQKSYLITTVFLLSIKVYTSYALYNSCCILGALHLEEIWKRNARISKDELFGMETCFQLYFYSTIFLMFCVQTRLPCCGKLQPCVHVYT